MKYLKNFINDEEGQDLVEYALLLALVAVASVLALSALGGKIGPMFNKAGADLT